MSINNRLFQFSQNNLVIGKTAVERFNIKTSIDTLAQRLNYQLGSEIETIVPFGSYTRNTILPRRYDSNSDIDLLITFTSDKTPQTFRLWLKQALENAYPRSVVFNSFPTVTMELNHIKFDLVPCKTDLSFWTGAKRFYIPDDYSNWKETVPNDLNRELEQANQRFGGNIVRQIIRLCKHWNCAAGYPWGSYELEKELVTLNYFGKSLFTGFIFAIKHVGSELPGVNQAIYWINTFNSRNDELKVLQWMKKLLPGLS